MYENDVENDPYAFGEDTRKEYEQAGSNLLTVPEGARPLKGGNGFRWSEYLQLVDLEFETPGVNEPEKQGDVTFLLHYTFEVTPESVQDEVPSPNIGKRIHLRSRYNMGAYRRARENNTGFQKGQAAMTQMSNALVKRFLDALELDTDLGMTPKLLATTYKGDLVGQKIWGLIKQAVGKGQDRAQDEIIDFISDEV